MRNGSSLGLVDRVFLLAGLVCLLDRLWFMGRRFMAGMDIAMMTGGSGMMGIAVDGGKF